MKKFQRNNIINKNDFHKQADNVDDKNAVMRRADKNNKEAHEKQEDRDGKTLEHSHRRESRKGNASSQAELEDVEI